MQKSYLLLTTCPDQHSAELIARTLVAEKLAACVNILPALTSVYAWQGKVETSTELQLLIKTSEYCLAAAISRLSELHPYELPEAIAIEITHGSRNYLQWLHSETLSHD